MDPDQNMTDENPNDIVERTVRNLNSEKLALRRQFEYLQKQTEHQSEIINRLTYEKANIRAEKVQLQNLCNENQKQQEDLEIAAIAGQDNIQFFEHVATQNETAMKDLSRKVEGVEVWTEMCKEAIVHTNEVEEKVYQGNLNLKIQIESLVGTEKTMRTEIQNFLSNEKILKQESIDVKLQLENTLTHQHQLQEKLHQAELQYQNILVTGSNLELQIKDLELKSENMAHEGLSLQGEIQNIEGQIQILISEKEQLEVQMAVVLSSNEVLVNEGNSYVKEAQARTEDIALVDKKRLELEKERDLQNDHLASATSDFESLTKSKETVELELDKVLQEMRKLKEDNKNIQTNLNSVTETHHSLKEALQVSQNHVATLENSEALMLEEIESLKKNILDIGENYERERTLDCNEINSHAQAEDALKQALKGLQDRLNSMDLQTEEQLKELEGKCLSISTLQSDNQCLEEKMQDLEMEVQRLEEVDLKNVEELAVLQNKCVPFDALTSRINNLSLENDGLKIQVASVEEITHQLKQEVRDKVNESDDLKSLLKKLEQDLEEKLVQLFAFKEKIRIQNQGLLGLHLTEDDLRKEIDNLKNQLEDLGGKSTSLEQQFEKSSEKIEELESELRRSVDVSTGKAAALAKLSQAFETLLKTSREKEELLLGQNSAIRSEIDSTCANFNLDLEAGRNDLEGARDENQKLQSLFEGVKRRILESEKLKKSLNDELHHATQERERLSVSMKNARSQAESLIAGLNDTKSDLVKMEEIQHRLMKEKEATEIKLTSLKIKNGKLEATIRELRNDIEDMIVAVPAAANDKPYLNPSFNLDLPKEPEERRRVSSNTDVGKNPEKVLKRTPSKSYSRQPSAPAANPPTVAAKKMISPIKSVRVYNPVFTDTDMSFDLDDTLGFSQPKASGIGLGQAVAKKTGVVAAKAHAKDATKNKKPPRFFRQRRV